MTFTANIDKKYTVWQNHQIRFEAENMEAARELLEKHDGIPPNVEFTNSETLTETEESITKEDNSGNPVLEIHDIDEV